MTPCDVKLHNPTVVPKAKCGTCAYKRPPTREDLEMTVAYYVEGKGRSHSCHERAGVYCLGSAEQHAELERLVGARMAT